MAQEETIADAVRRASPYILLLHYVSPISHAASAAFMICANFYPSWKESPGSTYVALDADTWAVDAI